MGSSGVSKASALKSRVARRDFVLFLEDDVDVEEDADRTGSDGRRNRLYKPRLASFVPAAYLEASGEVEMMFER